MSEDSLDLQVPGLLQVRESRLLGGNDLERLQALVPELLHVVATRTIFRTPTEARFSVLNDIKHPTPSAKYHQAKLEQAVMLHELIKLSFSFRRASIDLSDSQARLKKATGYQRQRIQVDIDELAYNLLNMRKEALERLRELEMWSRIKGELAEQGEFDRDSKDTDELLALARRYTLELPVALRSIADVGGAVNVIAQAETLQKECKRRCLSLVGP